MPVGKIKKPKGSAVGADGAISGHWPDGESPASKFSAEDLRELRDNPERIPEKIGATYSEQLRLNSDRWAAIKQIARRYRVEPPTKTAPDELKRLDAQRTDTIGCERFWDAIHRDAVAQANYWRQLALTLATKHEPEMHIDLRGAPTKRVQRTEDRAKLVQLVEARQEANPSLSVSGAIKALRKAGEVPESLRDHELNSLRAEVSRGRKEMKGNAATKTPR